METVKISETMKQQILKVVFDRFDNWSTRFGFACNKGCAACCTTDVFITAPEGKLILDYILSTHAAQWLKEKLDGPSASRPLLQTTNDYAKDCLQGRLPKGEEIRRGGICPFLEDECCSIYPARPFSCRCFASTVCCRNGGNALLPPEYLSAATAVSQIIEHVGQFDHWGTMIDVLTLQAAAAGCIPPGGRLEKNLSVARSNCLTAKPLPGFLIEEKHYEKVAGLVEDILSARLKGRSIEDILNSR
jgi:Fe-S-cluster containining protein